jgi:hopanoid biosynthesis associated RND transporter like protein HpnN
MSKGIWTTTAIRSGIELSARSLRIASIVTGSCNRPVTVILVAVMLAILAIAYSSQHFTMMTDTAQLISRDVSWWRDKETFDTAFPQQNDLMVVIVDGATPELTASGVAELAARLSMRTDLYQTVKQPDGGPFFEQNGLLYLPLSDVDAITRQLISSQPFLGALAADPSLRGVMSSISTALQGVQIGQAKLEDLDASLRALADALERLDQGKPAFFSWQALISNQSAGTRETRRLILVQPRLDYGALQPGARASDAIRQTARDLHLTSENGVKVRLTGPIPLADEEFSTLADRAAVMTTAMIIGVLIMLWLAVRSFRIIICIAIATFLGLALTTGLGLLVVGRFNLISVAFIPLFVGLGVDFDIQFCVRYRAERLAHPDLKNALIAAGSTVGSSLALAAGAVAIGFFAFLPTAYLGVAELGLIAGIGMVIAFLTSITLLPALLTLANPGGETAEIGFAVLAPVGRYLVRRRLPVLAIAGLAAVACLVLLPLVRFDFDPLHLKSPDVESMSTLIDLMSDSEQTPNTIDILASSLSAADELSKRLSALPEVAQAITLSSFIPSQQPEKLTLIGDASTLLGPTLNPVDVQPVPSDAETARSLAQTANALREVIRSTSTLEANDAARLAAALERLAAETPAMRSSASKTLITPLSTMLDLLRAQLRADSVTLQTLPANFVEDWITTDGRARIEVFPKGDSNDNKTLQRFSKVVRAIAPDATGTSISIQEAGRTIVNAFIQAGIWSFLAITVLLAVFLRRARDVILTLVPVLLTGLLTLGTCVLIGQPLNFANIIALPLLFGIGVAFNIYFVMAWRSGETNLLQTSLTRAVLFSALTTATALGSLWLSAHPGTASMGKLLMISLGWTLVTALLFEPALLGSQSQSRSGTEARWSRIRRSNDGG